MQADHYFSRKEYVLAARYYAKSKRSFEEVSLKFVSSAGTGDGAALMPEDQGKLRKALKIYLLGKLRDLAANEKMQKTILCMWLVEMYLNEMNDLGLNMNAMAMATALRVKTLQRRISFLSSSLLKNRMHV